MQHVRFEKVGKHVVVGKETLKFGSIFGSLLAFPSLCPKVKRERSQVALFLLCVVSPEDIHVGLEISTIIILTVPMMSHYKCN